MIYDSHPTKHAPSKRPVLALMLRTSSATAVHTHWCASSTGMLLSLLPYQTVVFANGCLLEQRRRRQVTARQSTQLQTSSTTHPAKGAMHCIADIFESSHGSFLFDEVRERASCSMQQCVRIESHQQWLAWFTVGNRLSNGVVLKIFEAVDMATLSRCCSWFKVQSKWFPPRCGLGGSRDRTTWVCLLRKVCFACARAKKAAKCEVI